MLSFPLDIGESEITEDALENAYNLAASASTGGMYPVGANGLWHGGVHLSLRAEAPVYACAPGRIVAARLDPDDDRATCEFGHTNFILTKHTWPPSASAEEGTPFFALYMHLAPTPLKPVAQRADVAPWLTGKPLRRVTAESGLTVRHRPRLSGNRYGGVPNGGLLKPRGEPSERDGYRWQEVGVLRQDLEGYVALGPLENGRLQTQWTEQASPPGKSDLVGQLKSGDVAKLDVPVRGGEMLWWCGEYGRDFEYCEEFQKVMDDAVANAMEMMGEGFDHPELIERAPTLHWEIFSGEKIFGAGTNNQGASQNGTDGGTENGENENDGSTEDLEMPSWTTKVSSKSNRIFNPEESGALSLIEQVREESEIPDPTAYRTCELDDKKAVYFLDAGKQLRTYAVKHVSECGIQDLDRAIEKSPGRTESVKDDLKALQWWDEAKSAGVKLPESPKVWHYHPVTALKALAAKRPRFFANVGGKQKEVATYEDVRDAVFQHHGVPEQIGGIEDLHESDDEADVPAYNTVVEKDLDGTDITVKRSGNASSGHFASVEAGPVKDKHGSIVGWKRGVYDFAAETPGLYEMLIEGKKMRPGEPKKGVPDLSDFDRDVWAALSESEAHLKGINTWDRALVTIGPIQQTLGVGDAKGELQGALHTAWRSAPDAYKGRLGRHGLQPKGDSVDVVQGAKKAHATLRGEPLDSAGKKKQLQQFKWIDRLAEAFGDPALRYWMLKEGFKRLERIRNREMTLSVGEGTIETTIGEIFRRDLSQALLLDWHVNSPADVWSQNLPSDPGERRKTANNWLGPVQRQLREWGITSLSQIRKNQELQLTATVLEARMGNMTNPARRAAKILKYAEADLIERMFKQVGYTKTSEMSQNNFITRSLTEHMNAKAEAAWSEFTPPETVLTFEKYSNATQGN